MQIDNFYVHLAMGQGKWTGIPEINKHKENELNEIGYTGKLNGKRITLQEYLDTEFPHNTRFNVELIRHNNMEFSETYLVTRVII